MIEFRKKTPEDLVVVNSLKDFPLVAMECFLNHRGKDLYPDASLRTIPVGTKLYGKGGKYTTREVKGIIKETIILHPASLKEYKASDFIFLGPQEDTRFDLVFTVDHGLIVPSDFQYYAFLIYTLTKYHRPESTWEYKTVEIGNNPPKPIITVPKSLEGWKELMRALTEFCVTCKIFLGALYQIHLVEDKLEVTKLFSITSFIPTAAALLYTKLIVPLLSKRLLNSFGNLQKVRYSGCLLPNLKNLIDSKYSDKLVIADLGKDSYFLNLTKGDSAEKLRKMLTNKQFLERYQLNPEKRRCEVDWWAYAAGGYDNGGKPRDLIMIYDADPEPAIFHEFGHFLENHSERLGKIQRGSQRGIFSDSFARFVAFLLGFAGPIGELVGWLSTFALRFPKLIAEFEASYIGLQVMKECGATEEDLKNAKETLKKAFQTYLLGTSKRIAIPAYGRLTREGGKILFGKIKR